VFAKIALPPAQQDLYTTYLFVNYGHLFTTKHITAGLGQVFKSVGATVIGMSEYRHVAIALMEKHIRSPVLEDLLDEQAGHSHQVA
ncbi:hypothetical protein EV182_006841, partial [Spiromyces aspiralis]